MTLKCLPYRFGQSFPTTKWVPSKRKANALGVVGSVLLAATLLQGPAFAMPDEVQTTAHKTGYQTTGRYDEVPALCQAFLKKWPNRVRVETFGATPQGRPMLALVVTGSGVVTPKQAAEQKIPVMLFQGGIHSGEIDGKDAGFWALSDLLERNDPLLDKVVLVFVPVFNVDGHERFGRWNRPNQNGPEEMGWRVTSANLNLNRDYAKAESPEMQAMLGLLERWDPILYVDLHATNGAQFQPDIAFLVEPKYVGDPKLVPMTLKMQRQAIEKLESHGSMPLDFYPSFRTYSDPSSGFSDGAYPPRFSTGYWALRNRMVLLVETHSWKAYPERVKATKQTIEALAELTARDGKSWLAQAQTADHEASMLAKKPVPVRFKTAEKVKKTLKFPGYSYRWEDSPISGSKALVYDTSQTAIWEVPYYDDVEAEVTVDAPGEGYLIPVTHARWVGEKLRTHGIEFRTLEAPVSSGTFQSFRASTVKLAPKTLEGKTMATFQGGWAPDEASFEKGALFVPIAQPKARLVMALLEPQASDSFAAWGYFNAHFEQKEYMEEYVIEQVARTMLKEDPKLREQFEKRLKDDPEFAKDPDARWDFFYRLHPSYDVQMNLYPVFRVEKGSL